MENTHGYLVISLDFELLWGVFDVMELEKSRSYFENTRKVIPQLLEIFENNNIHATWATVGMLFNKDWDEWKNNVPGTTPNYNNLQLSAYYFGKEQSKSGINDLCFASEIIPLILQVPGQELGTHTYSHYYCQEPGQDLNNFKEDLLKSIELALKLNISLNSLVFPRNQLKKEYLQVCLEKGIKNVRSNPKFWYWKNAKSTALATRFSRTGDAYIPLGRKSYPLNTLVRQPGLPLEQPASRFLRPVETSKILRTLKLNRIFGEMEDAAKEGEIYHLWWHPHNFGDEPAESMKDLKRIIDHFNGLRQQYNFQSANMSEIGGMVP